MTLSRETTGPPLLSFAVWACVVCVILYATLQLRIRLHRQVASIPVVIWSRLHRQAPCDGLNGVTHVDVGNLRIAGLVSPSAPHSQPIYQRQEAIRQYSWLRDFIAGNDHVDTDGGRVQARVEHIEGPPGTGKSTITWLGLGVRVRTDGVGSPFVGLAQTDPRHTARGRPCHFVRPGR